MRGPGGLAGGSAISTWVQENFTAVTIGGSTFYDLTQPLGAVGSTAAGSQTTETT